MSVVYCRLSFYFSMPFLRRLACMSINACGKEHLVSWVTTREFQVSSWMWRCDISRCVCSHWKTELLWLFGSFSVLLSWLCVFCLSRWLIYALAHFHCGSPHKCAHSAKNPLPFVVLCFHFKDCCFFFRFVFFKVAHNKIIVFARCNREAFGC